MIQPLRAVFGCGAAAPTVGWRRARVLRPGYGVRPLRGFGRARQAGEGAVGRHRSGLNPAPRLDVERLHHHRLDRIGRAWRGLRSWGRDGRGTDRGARRAACARQLEALAACPPAPASRTGAVVRRPLNDSVRPRDFGFDPGFSLGLWDFARFRDHRSGALGRGDVDIFVSSWRMRASRLPALEPPSTTATT